MRMAKPYPRITPALVLGAIVSLAAVAACGDGMGPRRAPNLTRKHGGDSMVPGAMVRICRPDDQGCVPTYAVTCRQYTPTGQVVPQQLSPEEQAFCDRQSAATGR